MKGNSPRLAGVAVVACVAVGAAASSKTAPSRRPAYCTIPTKNYSPWGFHTGLPITGPTGSYAHGHGDFNPTTHTASGIMCQVDRVHHKPDRQIILSADHHLDYYSHVARRFGVPGNLVKLGVRVKQSTDLQLCGRDSRRGDDLCQLQRRSPGQRQILLPGRVQGHRHMYEGPSLVTNVEPG